MAGISSKKLGSVQEGLLKNEYGYNEKELWDEADLYWYEYGFRNYDAQIGRFVQIDPLADEYGMFSGYHYALNDPIGYVDVDGLYPGVPTEAFNAAYTGAGTAAKVLPEVIVQATRHVSSAGKAAATLSIISGAIQIADVATDFTPFVGSGKDIYEGVRDGNWLLAGLGVVGMVADAFGGSIVKGTIKSILKSGAKKLAEDGAEQLVKRKVVEKAGKEAAKAGGRVFWSGGNTAKNAAEAFANSNGMKTLEMTTGGKIMTTLNPVLPRSISSPIWNRMSANFANGARGSVNVFHNATDGIRLNSVWRTTEYPILNNNNVNIFYHNVFR